ncbi:hypothetical protein LCGC14_2074480 [marine sediment metagenome]|uniref:Uncharacterized protein n=1 Tax=marine sediment metagenome TaxID=412755 RepID=A0A0F9F4R6_9ZZZZ
MRYVAKKITVVKIADTSIKDLSIKKEILRVLQEKEITCSIRLMDESRMDEVRISEIKDDNIIFNISKGGSILKRISPIERIAYLECSIEDTVLDNLKPGITRWNLLSHDDLIEDDAEPV